MTPNPARQTYSFTADYPYMLIKFSKCPARMVPNTHSSITDAARAFYFVRDRGTEGREVPYEEERDVEGLRKCQSSSSEKV